MTAAVPVTGPATSIAAAAHTTPRTKMAEPATTGVFPIVSVTRSVINVRKWIAPLIAVREKEGLADGPAFYDTEGYVASSL